jgi:RimJ/RimL family protein N-acetyltransferase
VTSSWRREQAPSRSQNFPRRRGRNATRGGSAVEVGWRLPREHWGLGYATDAGRAAIAYGFDELGLDEIVSFTSHLNEPSRRVMERLGMSRDPADDFEHPPVPVGHPPRPQVLCRLSRAAWAAESV